MRKHAFSVSFLVCFCFFMSSPAHAKRIALVIGNDDYLNVTKLQKAVNDAKAVANTVRGIGFKVIEQTNVNRRSFDELLNKFNAEVEAGDEVLFFFAGHGISIKGQNFLLPTDIPKISPGRERSVTKEAFSEDEIISLLQERGAKVSILIIDACRNNPFPKAGTRSVGRSVGLGQRTNPPRNTFVMYSAGIGEKALDRLSDEDNNPNSVFTRKLIPLLKTPGLSHLQMAKKLQIEVEELALTTKSQHKQFPAFYDQVRGNFYLIPDKNSSRGKIPTQNSAEETLWKTIENSKKASDFKFYRFKFPNGKYAAVAELKLNYFSNEEDKKSAISIDKRELVLQIQNQLKRIGCSPGTIDGVWGEKTKLAINRYNKTSNSNLSIEGPDQHSLFNLTKASKKICKSICPANYRYLGGKCQKVKLKKPVAKKKGNCYPHSGCTRSTKRRKFCNRIAQNGCGSNKKCYRNQFKGCFNA